MSANDDILQMAKEGVARQNADAERRGIFDKVIPVLSEAADQMEKEAISFRLSDNQVFHNLIFRARSLRATIEWMQIVR